MTHDCKYYPCHTGLTNDEFDCEMCYCPMYFIPNCGGNYKILKNGVKDCSDCTINHTQDGKLKIKEILKRRL